jgi:SHS2 domain-containing protein
MREYEVVPHTADLKIYAFGTTFEELFRNALKGMFSAVKPLSPLIHYADEIPTISHYKVEHKVVVHSLDREALLVDFLSECLYLSDTHNEAYFDARFSLLSDTELEGIIFGIPVEGYEVFEIKAVTYHDLLLEKIEGIWRATLVFDI